MSRKRPMPLQGFNLSGFNGFSLTESGTFTECGLKIGKQGMVISQDDSLESFPSRPCSASTLSSFEMGIGSRQGTAGTDGAGSAGDVPFKVSLEDFEDAGYLGSGSSGVVKLVRHKVTGDMLVMKVIPFDVNDEKIRRQVIMELRTMHAAVHDGVLRSFESFLDNGAIVIMMEYMDGGSLAHVFKAHPEGLTEGQLAEVARQVLLGLHYLHTDLRVIHRDIKPSNLLLNLRGDCKIADFGVSGHLATNASKCMSWVGTATYMSPERIQGEAYGPDSDLWSLGLALLEGALGCFPYLPAAAQSPSPSRPAAPPQPQSSLGSFWDLLDIIVESPPPLPTAQGGRFSPEFCDFVSQCLLKDPAARPTVTALLSHPWIVQAAAGEASLASLAAEVRARRGVGQGAAKAAAAAIQPPSAAPPGIVAIIQ